MTHIYLVVGIQRLQRLPVGFQFAHDDLPCIVQMFKRASRHHLESLQFCTRRTMLVSLCLFPFAMKYVSAVVFEPGSQPKWTFMYSKFVIIILFCPTGFGQEPRFHYDDTCVVPETLEGKTDIGHPD